MLSMKKIRHIIFFCTGNTCRSPMAEGIARKILAKRGVTDMKVESYGLLDLGSVPPAFPAQIACAAHGINISAHRSQKITKQAAEKADLILTMEHMHVDWLIENVSEKLARKAFLITEFGRSDHPAREEPMEIPDPVDEPQRSYNRVFKMLENEIERIISYLITEDKI